MYFKIFRNVALAAMISSLSLAALADKPKNNNSTGGGGGGGGNQKPRESAPQQSAPRQKEPAQQQHAQRQQQPSQPAQREKPRESAQQQPAQREKPRESAQQQPAPRQREPAQQQPAQREKPRESAQQQPAPRQREPAQQQPAQREKPRESARQQPAPRQEQPSQPAQRDKPRDAGNSTGNDQGQVRRDPVKPTDKPRDAGNSAGNDRGQDHTPVKPTDKPRDAGNSAGNDRRQDHTPVKPADKPRDAGNSTGNDRRQDHTPVKPNTEKPGTIVANPADRGNRQTGNGGIRSGAVTEKPIVIDSRGERHAVERTDRNSGIQRVERTERVQRIERNRDQRRVEAQRTGRGYQRSGNHYPSHRDNNTWRGSESRRSHFNDYHNRNRYNQYHHRYNYWNTHYNPYVYRYNDYYWSLWINTNWRYSYNSYYDYGFHGGFFYPTRHCHVEYYFHYPIVFWLYNATYEGYYDNYRYWYGNDYQAANVAPFKYARVFFPSDSMRDLGIEISTLSISRQTNFRSSMTLMTEQVIRRLRAGVDQNLVLRANEVVINHYENLENNAVVVEGYVSHDDTKLAFKALLDLVTPSKTLVFVPTSIYPTEQDLVQLDKMNDRIWELGGNPYQEIEEPADYVVEDVNPFDG